MCSGIYTTTKGMLKEVKMQAVICPVCNGTGKINLDPVGTGANLKVCHGCQGRGWVSVLEDRLQPIDNINYSQPPDFNRCPSCGGDRNSPALTGCPKGNHYGSSND